MENKIKSCCAFPDCHANNAKKWCGSCKIVKYCDEKCQRFHWKTHKELCKVWGSIGVGSAISHAKKILLSDMGTINERMYNASGIGRLTDVEKLIEAGGDIHFINKNDGTTCLSIACKLGHINIVVILLSHGAIVNHIDKIGGTPLFHATVIGNEPLISLLLEKGAIVDAATDEGLTALYIASMFDYIDVVKRLLLAGANPLYRNKNGTTPLDVAMQENHLDIIALIEKRITEMISV